MGQHVNLGVRLGGVGEIMKILRLAPIVDQNDVGKAVFQQPVDHGVQLFVRVKRGKNHGNFRYICHLDSSSIIQAIFLPQ